MGSKREMDQKVHNSERNKSQVGSNHATRDCNLGANLVDWFFVFDDEIQIIFLKNFFIKISAMSDSNAQ